jgi:hypothetical protein
MYGYKISNTEPESGPRDGAIIAWLRAGVINRC